MNRITVRALKPRNPLVAASLQRHAGTHRRCSGGLRQMDRRSLQRELRDLPLRHSP